MSTPQEPQSPPQTEPAQTEPDDEREVKFWAKLRQEIKGQVETTLDERDKKRAANQPPGTQRTGRSTIFDEFAKFMGGPFAPRDRKE